MSATTIQNSTRSFQAGEAIDAYTLVKVDPAGTVVKATATAAEPKIGYTVASVASGEAATISLIHGGGSSYAIANEAVAIGDFVYGDANGKLSASGSSGDKVGVTLTEATADGDVIEVLPLHS
jgi:hypothetical protein